MEPLNNLNRTTHANVQYRTCPSNITGAWHNTRVQATHPVNYYSGDSNLVVHQPRSLTQTPVYSPDAATVNASSYPVENNEPCYIRSRRNDILKDIEPGKHYNFLYSKYVISEDDMEEIRELVFSRRRRMAGERLLDIVQGYFASADPQRKVVIMQALHDSFAQYQPHLTTFLNLDFLARNTKPEKKELNTNQPLQEAFSRLSIKPKKAACENTETNQTNINRQSFDRDIKYSVQETGQ